MVVLGFLLFAAAVGLTVDVVAQNDISTRVDAFGHGFTIAPGWLFVAGVATAAVGLLGLMLFFDAVKRARRHRLALRESRGTAEGLQAERDRLAAELEAERRARALAEHDTMSGLAAPANR